MEKSKAIISMFLGELYWEFARFAPHIIYKKLKQYKDQDIKLIVATREDRLDIYGEIADIFVPIRLDETNMVQDCFRLTNYPENEYNNLVKCLEIQFKDRYEIIEKIYPKIDGRNFCNKFQFPKDKMTYKYFPREENKKTIEDQIITNKKIVVIAPRYRKGLSRNWIYWDKLYNLIYENKELTNRFEFVICGKNPDYAPDEKNRFLDINNFSKNEKESLIGLTIELIKKSILTVGSQSGIPNISLLLGVPVLEWGNQKVLHTVSYNVLKTPVTFLDDMNFNLSPEKIYEEMLKILNKGE